MLQLKRTKDPTMWFVVDLADNTAKSFPTYEKAHDFCVKSGEKFEKYCEHGLIRGQYMENDACH